MTRNFLLLSVAYASNIGGTGVITGSPPNLVVLNVLDSAYGEGVSPLTYASWMGFCVPLMVVNTVLAWVWIVLLKKMYTKIFPDIISTILRLNHSKKINDIDCTKLVENINGRFLRTVIQILSDKDEFEHIFHRLKKEYDEV